MMLIFILATIILHETNIETNIIYWRYASYKNNLSIRRIRTLKTKTSDDARISAVIGTGDTTNISYEMERRFGKKDLSTLADFIEQIKDSEYIKRYWIGKEIIKLITHLKNIDEFNLTIKTMQKIFSRGQNPFNVQEDNISIISFLSPNLQDFKRGLDGLDMIMSQIKDQRAIAAALVYSVPIPPEQGSFYESPEVGDTFIKNIDTLINYLDFMGKFTPSLLDRWPDHRMYVSLFTGGKNGPLTLSSNLEEYEKGLDLMREFYDAMNKKIYTGSEIWDFNTMLFNYPKLNIPLKTRLNNEHLYHLATLQDKAVASLVRNYTEFLTTVKAATKIALADQSEGLLFKINLALFLLRIIPQFIADSKDTQEFIDLINRYLKSTYNTQL